MLAAEMSISTQNGIEPLVIDAKTTHEGCGRVTNFNFFHFFVPLTALNSVLPEIALDLSDDLSSVNHTKAHHGMFGYNQ